MDSSRVSQLGCMAGGTGSALAPVTTVTARAIELEWVMLDKVWEGCFCKQAS